MDEMEDEGGGGDIPEWVVTFGDMMSLLLTFFIMLVSLSEIKEEEKYQALVESMRKQFGHDRSMDSFAPGEHRPRNSQLLKNATMGRAKKQSTMSGGQKVKAAVGEDMMVQSLRDADDTTTRNVVFFKDGDAGLTEGGMQTLRDVVARYRGKPLKIEVRGHASRRPLPTGTPYKDHWQLSAARCQNVMDFMTQEGIRPERLLLVNAGTNEPLYAQDHGRIELNDRVEIVMLNEPWQLRAGGVPESHGTSGDSAPASEVPATGDN